MRLLPCLLLAALAASPLRAASIQDTVFEAHLFDGISEPQTLLYRYEIGGSLLGQTGEAQVQMQVREVGEDGLKQVHFDMFKGPQRRHFGPVQAQDNNPLVLIFLQRDVAQMGNLTGASPGYFRNRLREAMLRPAEVAPLTVELDGAPVDALEVTIAPFENDPNAAQFEQFRHKRYRLVVSDAVPGGLYRIASETPDPDGKILLEESMTFASLAPPVAPGTEP
jgi:hypothetical protein